jgi:hypothetical protein
MSTEDEKITNTIKNTEILRPPKQSLYTFGTTNIRYYLLTEPSYSEMANNITETVIREGQVVAEKPRLVTPYYLSRLEGFGTEARRYFETLIQEHGSHSPGLFYTYRNEPKELNIVSDSLLSVVEKLNAEIDRREDPLAAIIKGQDDLWDVSLMKFIYEITRSSVEDNLSQLGSRGLLSMDSAGVPAEARTRIEELFRMVARGECDPGELKEELDRWGLFSEYEDRFLSLFRR